MQKWNKWVAVALVALTVIALFAGCAQKGKKITCAADLVGARIAVQEATTGDLYASEIEGATVSRFKKPTDAGLDLINGNVDCLILDEQPALRIVEKNPDKLMMLDETLFIDYYAIAVKKGNAELVSQLNASIERQKSDGTYDTLMSIFVGKEDLPVPEIPEYEAVNGQLVMGTNAEFEPMEYRDDANNITGFDVEMAKQIAYDLKMELVIEDMAFDSVLGALDTGMIDVAISSLSNTEERRQNVDFSMDYYESRNVMVVKK